MKNQLIKGSLVAAFLLLLYSIVYIVVKPATPPTVSDSLLTESFYRCSRGVIIGVVSEMPICLNKNTIIMQNDSQIEIMESKDLEFETQVSIAEPYIVVSLPQKVTLLKFESDHFIQAGEYIHNSARTLLPLLRLTNNRLFLILNEELEAVSAESEKSNFTILEWQNNLFSNITKIKSKRLIKPLDLVSDKERILISYDQKYAFLETRFGIFEIANDLSVTNLMLNCETLTESIPVLGESLAFMEECSENKKELYINNSRIELQTEGERDVSLILGKDNFHFIIGGMSYHIQENVLSADPQEWQLKGYNTLNQMQLLGKGSIIGSERVLSYIDFKYTDQILYRLLLKTP